MVQIQDLVQMQELEYVSVQMVEHGNGNDIAIIIGEGHRTILDGNDKIKIPVEIKRQHYIWIPNKTSLRNLKDAYGPDTKDWIAKQVLFKVDMWEHNGRSGKMIVAKPLPTQNSFAGVKLGSSK